MQSISNGSNPLTLSGSIARSGTSYQISLQHSPDVNNALKIPQSIQMSQGVLNYTINGQSYSKPVHESSSVLMEKMQRIRNHVNEHVPQSGTLTNLSTLSPSQIVQLLSRGGNEVQSLGGNLYEIKSHFDPFQTGMSIEFRSILNTITGQIERSSVYENGVLKEEMLFETRSDGKKVVHSKHHSTDSLRPGKKLIFSREINSNIR